MNVDIHCIIYSVLHTIHGIPLSVQVSYNLYDNTLHREKLQEKIGGWRLAVPAISHPVSDAKVRNKAKERELASIQ